jgi:hypothetical protein
MIIVAEIYKIAGEVAAVAVKDQKSPPPARFYFRVAIEHLAKPGKTQVVVIPSCG